MCLVGQGTVGEGYNASNTERKQKKSAGASWNKSTLSAI